MHDDNQKPAPSGLTGSTVPIKAEGLTLAPLMTIEEAAELYRYSTKTVRRMIARGDLPAVRIRGQRAIRIRSVDGSGPWTPSPCCARSRRGRSAMTRSSAPTMPSGDVLLVEQIILTTVAAGAVFTIDDIRAQLDRAGLNPLAYGPLLHALHRREVIERVDSFHRTRKHGYNSGQRGMWRRPAPVSLHGPAGT